MLSSLNTILGRALKVVMAALVVPAAIGLLLGIMDQLGTVMLSQGTAREWVSRGFLTYVGLHVLFYRAEGLFRASHSMFSTLAVWLFGGQVSSVERATAGRGGRGQAGGEHGRGKGGKGEAGAGSQVQGSTMVAFSPYVVPLLTMLVCAGGWALTRWWDQPFTDVAVAFFIGLTIGFHWLMTADALQGQRSRWHVETYLLALGLVFVLTLLIGSACLPWAIPEFSFLQVLADGFSKTQAIYTALVQQLFF